MCIFRLFIYFGYAVILAGCFFLTTEVVIPFAVVLGLPTQGMSATRKVMLGFAGAASFMGIIHPVVVPRCFVDKKKGQFTRLGRWVVNAFRIPEDRLLSVLFFPWPISILIGIILVLISLCLSL